MDNSDLNANEYLRGIVLNLPEKPGIYQYLNSEGTIIYVGKAKNLKKRVYSYFNKNHEPGKTRVLVSKIVDIRYIVVNSEEDAFAFESRRIDYLKVPGKVMGKHQGAHYFTKGQRKGLNVGGTKEPLFIIETDVEKNIVYTGQGNQHPGLFKKALFIANDEIHWIREDLALKEGEKMEVMARIRYRQPLQKATLHQFKDGMYVVFENPQSAITEGQFVAWHHDDEVLGSGVIA